MVSGLVTSPELQLRICFEEARPISMASKLLMSINACLCSKRGGFAQSSVGSVAGLFGRGLGGFQGLGVDGLGVALAIRRIGVVGGLGLLVGRVGVVRPHARQVDAELLGSTEEVVVLLAHLGPLA